MRRLASPSSVLAELEIARLANEREARRGERDAKVAGSYASALSSLVPSLADAGLKAYDVYGQQQLVDADKLVAENPDVGKDGQPTPNEIVAQARASKEDFDPFGMLSSVYKKRDTHALQGLQARADQNRAKDEAQAAAAAKAAREDRKALVDELGAGAAAQAAGARAAGPVEEDGDFDFGDEDPDALMARTDPIAAPARALAAAAGLTEEQARLIVEGRLRQLDDAAAKAAPKAKVLTDEEKALMAAREDAARAQAEKDRRPPRPRTGKPPAPDKRVDKITGQITEMDNALQALADIRVAKGSVNSGRLPSLRNSAAQLAGIDDPDVSTARARVGMLIADYIRSISGGSVTTQEREFLLKNIPTLEDDDDTFDKKLAMFEDFTRKKRAQLLKNAQATGIDVGGLGASAPASAAPAPTKRPAWAVE